MSRRDRQRLEDVRNACEAIGEYLAASDVDDGLVFDAVRMRLVGVSHTVQTDVPMLLAAIDRLLASVDWDSTEPAATPPAQAASPARTLGRSR